MAIGPDTYTGKTAGDLQEEDFEELAEIWPAAFVAAGKLLVLIHDGELPDDTELLNVNLIDLIKENERGELDGGIL